MKQKKGKLKRKRESGRENEDGAKRKGREVETWAMKEWGKGTKKMEVGEERILKNENKKFEQSASAAQKTTMVYCYSLCVQGTVVGTLPGRPRPILTAKQ